MLLPIDRECTALGEDNKCVDTCMALKFSRIPICIVLYCTKTGMALDKLLAMKLLVIGPPYIARDVENFFNRVL